MSLVNIISAVGNNSSVYPLLVRDCGIENPTKVFLTYKQNLKDSKKMAKNAVRERLIDEYWTSAVWLGGIPVMNKLCDLGIEKLGYDPKINMSLFEEASDQGIKYNIEKFKDIAKEEVKDLKKALKNKTTYQRLQAGKFVLSTAIPIAIMGFVLPKLNFRLTEKLNQKPEPQKDKKVSFKGLSAVLANMSNVNKMAITDGGLTVGRVTTARNKFEKLEMAFKMLSMMFLNFVFPIYLAKFLDKVSSKIFRTNVNLDPKLLANKDFLKEITNGSIEMPKIDKNADNIIEFLDKKPNSRFAKLCEEYCGVKYLSNGIRDPRVFVDKKKISAFQKEIEKFISEAKTSTDITKYAKKALKVKSFNILANVVISSFLLAVTLPQVTFWLRKKVTGSDAEPGLVKII